MAIIQQLGINITVFYQFMIFAFAFIVLSQVVFKPYLAALELREEKTKGSEEIAGETQKKASDLQHQYESKAREVNSQIKTIFDTYRGEANEEVATIVNKARGESQKLIESVRAKVTIEITEAGRKLKDEIPEVAGVITKKLVSRN